MPIGDLKELDKYLKEREEEVEGEDYETKESHIKEALKQYQGDDRIVSFKEWKELNKGMEKSGFSTGIARMDDIIGGFHKGDLITITAATGNGKTSMAQFLTAKFAEEKKKCLWFSYEMPVASFLTKFGDNLPDGYLPNVLNDTSLVWIERRIVEAMVKYETEVVFIDHLHYLFDLSNTKSVSLEIGSIMRQLKRLAIKYNITVFIIAHTVKTEEGMTISINSLRDSSFVGQESDTVIGLWRIAEKQKKKELAEEGVKYTNYTRVAILKNRYKGQLASFSMSYHPETNTFIDNIELPPQ